MNNGQLESLAASDINAFVAQAVQKFRDARSLGELKYLYMSAIRDVWRILGPRIGPSERPEERQVREAFRVAYDAIFRERRREYQRNYMRRWRAANPEKAKAQNRKAARTYREFTKVLEAGDNYYANL